MSEEKRIKCCVCGKDLPITAGTEWGYKIKPKMYMCSYSCLRIKEKEIHDARCAGQKRRYEKLRALKMSAEEPVKETLEEAKETPAPVVEEPKPEPKEPETPINDYNVTMEGRTCTVRYTHGKLGIEQHFSGTIGEALEMLTEAKMMIMLMAKFERGEINEGM